MQTASLFTQPYLAQLTKTHWDDLSNARAAAVSASRRTGTDWLIIALPTGGFRIKESDDEQ